MADSRLPEAYDFLSGADEWGPEKVIFVSDTRTGMKGVLVIDNTARGMGKGGTRMSPTVTFGEVARLARTMTWKWAAADLFFGGAKAGIRADPNGADKETILRAWARALAKHIPSEYVLGLDMGLTERDAAVVQDELGDRGAAVGSPNELGGIPYDQIGVTGFGVAEAADAACGRLGIKLASSRVAIQGFGAVGRSAAERLVEQGATVVAVSTTEGALHDPDGLDVPKLAALHREIGDGAVNELDGSTRLTLGEELFVDTDILIPAAIQDVLIGDSVKRVTARLIVEGANLPTDADAQAYFATSGVTIVPDFIANAGGIIAAGFAMDARYSAFRPSTDVVFTTIADKIRSNTEAVLDSSQQRKVTPHEAAHALAEERVREAMRLKGRIRQ